MIFGNEIDIHDKNGKINDISNLTLIWDGFTIFIKNNDDIICELNCFLDDEQIYHMELETKNNTYWDINFVFTDRNLEEDFVYNIENMLAETSRASRCTPDIRDN